MQIQENFPLAPLTTLGVGGPARYFIEASSDDDVLSALDFAKSRDLPVVVLGGGSNLLVSDAGFRGVVLKPALRQIVERGPGVWEAAAGDDWDGFVAHCVHRNLAGVECLSGIPGTVGGTPVQNVGAYGQEVSATIANVAAIELASGKFHDLGNRDCGFAYRSSIFNTTAAGRFIILRVTFQLAAGGDPCAEYRDLKKHFGGRRPTLAETREAVRSIRHSKAMLIVPGDEDCRSAGSFFKNPVIGGREFSAIAERYPDVPHWPAPGGMEKVSAAWLVEKSGFAKGWKRGAVGISSKHALAIINRGGATAADIVALKTEIQQKVLEKFSVSLQPEPVMLGF